MEFGELHLGQTKFELFSSANVEDMIGLELPFVINCAQSDRANLRTLVHLLKKTRILKLTHISHTWTILKVIAQHPGKFTNIKGLHIDYDANSHDTIMGIPAEFMAHISSLGLHDQTYEADPDKYITAAVSLIEKTKHLQHLKLTPAKKEIRWVRILDDMAARLR